MTEWRLPAAVDAIVAALSGVGVQVWDGPILTDDYSDAIYIGFDGDYSDTGDERAASTRQEWAGGIGQRRRSDEHDITCAIVVLVGEAATSWKPVRDKVAALLETVGQALRSDVVLGPSLGLSAPSVAQISGGDLFQEAGPEGMQARFVFSINYRTRV